MENIFQKLRFFNKLSEEEITNIINNSVKCSYKKGDYLFKEGDSSDSFHIICSGEVEVFVNNFGNSAIELLRTGEGSVIGEVGFIDGKERTASVRCIEPTKTLLISIELFDKIIQKNPNLALKMLKEIGSILSERLRWCDKVIVSSDEVMIDTKFLNAIELSST